MDKFIPTKVEEIAGSLPAGVASNSIAVLGTSITPLAAFVPFLVQTLATRRHAERVERALQAINDMLVRHEGKIHELSDAQYKLINEAISTLFQTVDEAKIEYLKRVVANAVDAVDLRHKDVSYISRIIRDISAEEIDFLVHNFQYEHIFFGTKLEGIEALSIEHGSDEEVVASGLINMGLIYSKVPTFDSVRFEFSPVVAKLLAIVDVHKVKRGA